MGNLIVGTLLVLIVGYIVFCLYREHKRYGSCAYCSYAKNGCDHVGHKELDYGMAESKLNEKQKEILRRYQEKKEKRENLSIKTGQI